MPWFDALFALFGYDFMQRALLVGVVLGASCALLGVFLILRKQSLIGDGLAHVSLATTALSLVLGLSPLWLNLPLVIAAAFGILALTQKVKVHSDAAIGLVSSVAVALGVVLVSVNRGFHIDLMSYLFGSILLISPADVPVSVVLALLVVGVLVWFRRDLMSLTFDEDFARVQGIRVARIQALLVVLTAVTIAVGMRVVGTLLISSLLILPGLTALQLARSFGGTLAGAVAIAVGTTVVGMLVSAAANWPTGATMVLVGAGGFLLAAGLRLMRR